MRNCCPPESLKFFKAIGDNHRQLVLALLKVHKTLNASEIKKYLKLSQPTVSHHLSLLSNAGVVTAKKQGKEVIYSLSHKNISSCCLGFLNALKN